jgi:hypothetical protein
MGNQAHSHFHDIQTKHGQAGVDYIVFKSNQRNAQAHTKDEVQRVHDHANLQEREDVEFINQ